jgi:hypothetical protein
MNKIFLLSFFLLLIACSQNQTEKEKNSKEKIVPKNNTILIKTDEEKVEETKEIETEENNSKNNQSSSSEVASNEKKDINSVEEKANKTKKTSVSLKELPTFYFKTRKVTYNPCKNKNGEYMFVLYVKDEDNVGTLSFHDGRQKYILPYEGISKDGDKYTFHTKPFAEFGNTPMNVQLVLVGDDLTVTFLNKKTNKTLDKQTFVTEKGIQKYEANEC